MGGNIFDNLKRINKYEYDSLYQEVKQKLHDNIFTKPSRIESTRSVKTKETFGDMDLIVESDYLKHDYIKIIKQIFGLTEKEIKKNGSVLSFKYKDFQIDLLLSPSDIFQNMYDYFSWNDLSNIIGRLTHKHGLKFGHDGTYITLRDDTYQIAQVLVTKSTKELFDYMQLDYDEWNDGFDGMGDAFRWVSMTPYFNKDVYAFENRNSEATRRDKKRPNYHAFLEWVEGQNNLPSYNYQNTSGKFGYNCVEPFYSMICQKFPHVKIQTEMHMGNYEKQVMYKEKINGEIVSKITGLTFKELGEFMKYFRRQVENNSHLFDWIISDTFTERHRELFIGSLLWHMKNGKEYGK